MISLSLLFYRVPYPPPWNMDVFHYNDDTYYHSNTLEDNYRTIYIFWK